MTFIVESIWGQLTVRPCPSCGAESRHPKRDDPRGPITLYGDHAYCFECGWNKRVSHIEGLHLTPAQQDESRVRKPYPEIPRIERFWSYCTGIGQSSDVHQYCEGRFGRREFDVPQALARRLPDFTLETDEIRGWKHKRKLIFPLYDAKGVMRSVIARSIAAKPKVKSMSPRGFTRVGLCLMRPGDDQRVVICEGEMDWLAWSLFGPEDTTVYGIFAGAITGSQTFLSKHRFAEVLIATDIDEAGDKYATDIRKKLHETCKATRWDPQMKRANDACDVLKDGGTLDFEGLL